MDAATIAIIGGGLVGASLALALQEGARKRGWRIRVIEPYRPGDDYQPSYDARSSALSLGTRQLYDQLGIWPAIASQAAAITEIQVSEQGRFGMTCLEAHEEQVPALGYVVDNAWIGHCLWQALDENLVTRECPAEVRQLQPVAGGGYRLDMVDGQQHHCDLAILADGGRSGLRGQLGIDIRQRSYGQTAIIANLTPECPHQGVAYERFTREGPMALLPLPDNRCALVLTRPTGVAERLLAMADEPFLAELHQAFGYRLGAFLQMGQRHAYPLALVQSAEQVRSGLVVLGNAAHSLHPIAGQGYNLSLRDVMVLADTLLHSPAPPGTLATLQQYYARQQADQWLTIGFSDRLVQLFARPGRLLSHGRAAGLVALDLCPAAKHQFARQAMGLGDWA